MQKERQRYRAFTTRQPCDPWWPWCARRRKSFVETPVTLTIMSNKSSRFAGWRPQEGTYVIPKYTAKNRARFCRARDDRSSNSTIGCCQNS